MTLWDTLPDEWQAKLEHLKPKIDQISIKLQSEEQTNPSQKNIFRALTTNPKDIRVVILGQDPYPNPALAMGLAFSVPEKEIVPPSLRNIQKELKADLGLEIGNDLSNWAAQGVLLLNRILTCRTGKSLSHEKLGWQEITEEIIKIVNRANPNVVGVLWGKTAQELAPYFKSDLLVKSPHPSGLSAHRGFFGSKPFSKVNDLLVQTDQLPINWG